MTAMMSFGIFVFSIPTLLYDELQRKTDYRFGRTGRVGARDATQFIGPGDQTISLSGTVYDEISDGMASLDDLHDMASSSEAQPLLCSNGRIYGNFVITGIDERHKIFARDGTPLAIDFGIDLLRVDDEDLVQDSARTDSAAAAVETATAATEKVSASGLTSTVGKLTDLASTATAKINAVNRMMDRLGPQISAMTRTLDMLGIVDAGALAGVRDTITVLSRGAASTATQASSLLNIGLNASSVAVGMANDPGATVNDVLGRLNALPNAQQASAITGLFGTANASTINALVQNFDQLQQELGT